MFFILLVFGWFSTSVAESYYAIPTSTTPCPTVNSSCLTLSQYAGKPSKYFTSNVTIILLPGNHTLDSEFRLRNVTYLTMFTEYQSAPFQTTSDSVITCKLSAKLELENIEQVAIENLTFVGCTGISVTLVDRFTISYCVLYTTDWHELRLELNTVANVNMTGCSFTRFADMVLPVPVGSEVAGVVLLVNTSNISMLNTSFFENTAINTSIISAWNSNVSINNTFFAYNEIGEHSSILSVENSLIELGHSLFINNTCSGSAIVGCALHGVKGFVSIVNTQFLNTTSVSSGAILIIDGSITISKTIFFNNIASSTGSGAIKVINSSLITNNCSYDANEAISCGAVSITATSKATMEKNMFLNNKAHRGGGAVCIQDGSTVNMFNTTFFKNVAKYGGAMFGFNSSIVSNNTIFVYNAAEKGGAVCTIAESVIILQNSTFIANSADTWGSAVYNIYSTFFGANSIFSNNTAVFGGTVFVSHSTLTLNRLVFINNSADGSELKFINGTANWLGETYILRSNINYEQRKCAPNVKDVDIRGGAVYAVISTLFLDSCLVTNNKCTAVFATQSTISIVNTTFNNNTATDGGAVGAFYSVMKVENSVFINGTTIGGGGGGGIAAAYSTINMNNTTFINNTAMGKTAAGGAVAVVNCSFIMSRSVFKFNKGSFGGAMVVTMGSCILNHSSFSNSHTGGVIINDAYFSLNNVSFFRHSDGNVLFAMDSFGTIQNTESINNTGGSVFVITNCYKGIVIDNCAFVSNQIVSWDALFAISTGGAIAAIDSTVTIKQSQFIRNTMNFSLIQSLIQISANKRSSSRSDLSALGGAMYSQNSTVTIDRTTFSQNTCYVRGTTHNIGTLLSAGGALFATDSTVTIVYSKFVKNSVIAIAVCSPMSSIGYSDKLSATVFVEVYVLGGAIVGIRSAIEMDGTTFSQNKAHYVGIDTMSNISLIRFEASKCFGGSLYSENSVVTMKDTTFIENEADADYDLVKCNDTKHCSDSEDGNVYVSGLQSNGGAIYTTHSDFTILNGTFSQNRAYVGSAVTIDGNRTLFNNSQSKGGAVFSLHDSLIMKDTRFCNNIANISNEIAFYSISKLFSGTTSFNGSESPLPYFYSSYDFATTLRYVLSSGGSFFITDSNATIYYCDFLNNVAVLGSGMLISSCNVSFHHTLFSSNVHGVFSVLAVLSSTITMKNSSIANCTVLDGNKVTFINNNVSNQRWNGNVLSEGANLALRNGSVTYFENSNVSVTFSSFTSNMNHAMACLNCDVLILATHFKSNKVIEGGALIATASIVTISDSGFSNNTCQNKCTGSALATSNSTVVINNTIFRHNHCVAKQCNGGAVFIGNSKAHINGSLFIRNMCYTLKGFGYLSGAALASIYSLVTVHNTTFHSNSVEGNANSSNGGAVLVQLGTIHIDHSSFINNSASNGGAVVVTEAENVISNSSFVQNTAKEDGAAILCIQTTIALYNGVFLSNKAGRNGGAVYFSNKKCTIDTTTFRYNTALNEGGAIYLNSVRFHAKNIDIQRNAASSFLYIANTSALLSGNTILLSNNGSFLAFISNVTFEGHTLVMHNAYIINSTRQHLNSQYGGAVTGFQSEIVLVGKAVLMYNRGMNGGVFLLKESKLHTLGNITISFNTASESGAAIYAQRSELNFRGSCNISNNVANGSGGGIHIRSSTIRLLQGYLNVFENSAEKGGGLFLELDSKLYVIKTQPECPNNSVCDNFLPSLCFLCNNKTETWLALQFISNNALYGGAVYVSDSSTTSLCESECFIQTLAAYNAHHLYLIGVDTNFRNIFFINNKADVAGSAIFGGLLDRCSFNFLAEVFLRVTNASIFSQSLNAVSYLAHYNVTNLKSNETSLVISSNPLHVCFCIDDQPDCYYKPPTVKVRKGERFVLSLVAVDQVNNTVLNSTIYSIVSPQAGLMEGQSIQYTNKSCTQLQYNIVSPHDSEQLIIYADGPCKEQMQSRSPIDVIFTQCPIGFITTDTSCVCDPVIFPNYVIECSVNSGFVRLKPNVWMSYINKTDQQGFILYPHCPFDYCQPATKPVWIKLNDSEEIDKQCAFNRIGKLCGTCKSGFSLSLGSSDCKKCSSYWLVLLIVFGIAGILLVAFLLVCNLTVPVGTINGLIFYANIVASNRAILLPFEKPNFFTVFIAWLNLDFGFQTCFFNGMNGYIKTWLQLAFPLYTLFLVVMVINVSSYSRRFASMLSHKNPVATLATLILLSYTKLLRTIIAALSFARLEYPSNSYETVWLVDANILYLEWKHILLFIAAFSILLIGLIYTSLLFFWQWLMSCPRTKALMCLRNPKLYSFMDAYQNPYNMKHRYWTGLLLFTRALLYLIAALNVFGDPKINLLAIICVVGSLLLLKEFTGSRIYKAWTISILESLFLYNLSIFAATTLYVREINGNQKALAYISVSITFVTFLGILIYHTLSFMDLKPLLKWINKYRNTTLPHNLVFNMHEDKCGVNELVAASEGSVTEIQGLPTPNDTDDSEIESDTMSCDQNIDSSVVQHLVSEHHAAIYTKYGFRSRV